MKPMHVATTTACMGVTTEMCVCRHGSTAIRKQAGYGVWAAHLHIARLHITYPCALNDMCG